jgi:hypothetical protein
MFNALHLASEDSGLQQGGYFMPWVLKENFTSRKGHAKVVTLEFSLFR